MTTNNDATIGRLVREIGETEVCLRMLKDEFRVAMGSKPFDLDDDGKPTPEYCSVGWEQPLPTNEESV